MSGLPWGKNVLFWCVLFTLCLHAFIKRTLRIESTLKLRVSEWARTLSNKESLFLLRGQKVWFYYPTTSLHSLLAGVAKIMRWSNPICHTDEKEDDESHVTHKLGGVWAFEAGLKVKAGKTETRGPSLSFFLVSFYVTAWIDNINNMKGVRLHSNIYFLKLIYHFSSRAWHVSHSQQWSSRFTSPRYRLCHVELVTLHSLWKQMMSCL